jgi:3-oxoacyl-[acyl-carrier-protein] synthase II
MMDIFITGIGWVYETSMGYKDDIKVFDGEKGLPLISRGDVFKAPYKPFGRMDYFSKLGVSAAVFAMRDANFSQAGSKDIEPAPFNTGIIASSSTGCLETDIKYQATINPENNTLPSPALFAYTLPNCFLGEVSILYGLTGESFIVSEEKTNGMTGLGMAVDLLVSGTTDMVLCGINNSDINHLTDDSSSIGPGAVFFLLEQEKRKAAKAYGKLVFDSSDSHFYYENSVIDSLYDLASKCLKRNI